MIDKITPIFSARFALFCTTELYSDRVVYTTGVSIKKKKEEIPLANIERISFSPIPHMPGMTLTLNSGDEVHIKIGAIDRNQFMLAWHKLKEVTS